FTLQIPADRPGRGKFPSQHWIMDRPGPLHCQPRIAASLVSCLHDVAQPLDLRRVIGARSSRKVRRQGHLVIMSTTWSTASGPALDAPARPSPAKHPEAAQSTFEQNVLATAKPVPVRLLEHQTRGFARHPARFQVPLSAGLAAALML